MAANGPIVRAERAGKEGGLRFARSGLKPCSFFGGIHCGLFVSSLKQSMLRDLAVRHAMKNILGALKVNAGGLREAITSVLQQSAVLTTDNPDISSTNGLTFAQILSRAESIAGMASVLSDESEDKLLLAATNRLTAFRDHVGALRDGLDRLSALLSNIEIRGGFDRVDNGGIVYTKNGQTISVRAGLDEVVSLEDNALEPYLVLAAASRPRAIGTYSAASTLLSEKAAEASTLTAELKSELAAFRTEGAAISAVGQKIRETEAEAKRYLEAADLARRSIEEGQSKVTVSVESIEAARQQATKLEAEVRSYDDKFKIFQAALDERDATLDRGNSELASLLAQLQSARENVSELQVQAEQMLEGATIAGLSAEYKTRADAVNDQLQWARVSFYGSIGLIAVSVCVALNLTTLFGLIAGLPTMPTFTPDVSTGGMAVQILAGLGSRALVILPALLLAGFASHRHAMLFRLREEYSHKSAIAASVHGFKQQAPSYKEPIAAAVFTELLANPALTLDGKVNKAENRFLARLITPTVEAAMERLQKIPGGGGN